MDYRDPRAVRLFARCGFRAVVLRLSKHGSDAGHSGSCARQAGSSRGVRFLRDRFSRNSASLYLARRVLAGGLQRARLSWRSEKDAPASAVSSHLVDAGCGLDWGYVVLKKTFCSAGGPGWVSGLLYSPDRWGFASSRVLLSGGEAVHQLAGA